MTKTPRQIIEEAFAKEGLIIPDLPRQIDCVERQKNEEWLTWWQKEFESNEIPDSYRTKRAFIEKLLEEVNK